MITLLHNYHPITRTLKFAVIMLLVYAIFEAPLAYCQNPYTDTLIATSSEVKLHVIEAGSKEAQSIVLIPGWCFTAEIWNKQITALSDRYHIVTFDPRSQGKSTILNQSNSPDNRAEDIANLIKKLNLQKPVIVAWSQGVQDVAAYVLKFGTGEVSGLVFVDATVSAGAAGLDARVAAMTLERMPIYTSSPRDYLEVMMSYIFKKPLSPDEMSKIVTAALQTPSSIGVTNLVLDLFGKDYRPAFRRIEVPSFLIVAGMAPDKQEQLLQPVPNATSAVVDGAGHAVFYDEPAKFNDLLARFVEERVRNKAAR